MPRPGVFGGGQVRPEVIANDRDPDAGRYSERRYRQNSRNRVRVLRGMTCPYSTQNTTAGSPASGTTSPSAMAYRCSAQGLLHRIVRVLPRLPGLYPLTGGALLAEQQAQSLMADVVDHPLSHQELRQPRQAPGRKRQVVLGRPRPDDFLDLPVLHAPGYLW